MDSIKVKQTSNHVNVDFAFNSPQQFFFTVEVADENGDLKFTDKGQWDGKTHFDVGAGKDLINLYLNIYWGIIDPAGAGNKFDAIATISQNGAICDGASKQQFTGETVDDELSDITFAEFV